MEPLDCILTLNSGSSSLKVALYTQAFVASHTLNLKERSWEEAEEKLKPCLEDKSFIIGHRFVHGGLLYQKPTLVDDGVIENLHDLVSLAPLHNRPCLEGVLWAKKLWEKAPQYLVFDTAFFKEMPEVAKNYAIDRELAQKWGLWRFGFHGISHEYLLETYREKEPGRKVITLHLGSGCSCAAIRDGKPIETSMGFSPLEGLVMSTRSGDIDPQVVQTLCTQLDIPVHKAMDLLNHTSGLLGLSQKTGKMQELLQSKDPLALFAIDLFCHRLIKYIGGYIALLNGIDALIFSGGIGESAPEIRKRIVEGLTYFGFQLDEASNVKNTPFQCITKGTPKAFIIKTDENLKIAKQIAFF